MKSSSSSNSEDYDPENDPFFSGGDPFLPGC
ncbi:hypothetical protein EE612_041234 [Oryza sativa]|nr:hypothetical protein EE612_041234 [Oryza sativa]